MAANIEELKKEKIRREAYNNFFYFLRAILGYPDIEYKPHKELCDFITESPDLKTWAAMSPAERANKYLYLQKLIMLPRGHFKSTISTIGLPLWLLWHNPQLRILIDNEVLKNSKRFLAEMKAHISSPRLKAMLTVDDVYPFEIDYDVPGGWTEDSIILKNHIAKEPSVATAGVDTAVTSQHYDVIIMDDIVSERNITTQDQMDKVKQAYELAYSLLEPGGLIIVIGTRYHMNDLYSELLKDDHFQKLIRPAIDDDGNVLFPKKFSKERLDILKATQGKSFYSQYMLTPIGDGTTVFISDAIKVFDSLNDVPRNVNTFITVDLAISQKETADFTVELVQQVDSEGNIYAVDMRRGHYTPIETIENLFDLYNKWRPMIVGVETVAYQKALMYFLQKEMRERGIMFPLRELKADKDKIRRAMSFEPYVSQGMFHVYKPLQIIADEMAVFPFGSHDDCVDAVTYLPQIMRKPPKAENRMQEVYTPVNSITGY